MTCILLVQCIRAFEMYFIHGRFKNVTESCSTDDPPHEVCFVQPEYRVTEDEGGVDVSVRLNGTIARTDITLVVFARSTGNGEMDASGTSGDLYN